MRNAAQLIRALRGPVMLIVIGLLFVLDHTGGYGFEQTWPVLIILFGVMKLVERMLGEAEAPPHPAHGAAPHAGESQTGVRP